MSSLNSLGGSLRLNNGEPARDALATAGGTIRQAQGASSGQAAGATLNVNSPALQGFLRSDGRKGIRNCIVVAYLVECAHHVAREIVDSFRGQPVHLIGFGGCYPNAYADRMMNKLCTHPNVGGALLLSLG